MSKNRILNSWVDYCRRSDIDPFNDEYFNIYFNGWSSCMQTIENYDKSFVIMHDIRTDLDEIIADLMSYYDDGKGGKKNISTKQN